MLKKIVQLIHVIIVLISISALLSNNQFIIRMSAIINSYLLFKWTFVSSECMLTRIESILSNKKLEQGFIYRMLQPFINIKESTLYQNMYFIILGLTIVSYLKLYFLYNQNPLDIFS